MKLFKVKLKLHSAFASAWQADTIWGQLCWMLRYLYGEDSLQEFIQSYRAGNPPLIISNGFPGDLLPRPCLPQARAVDRDAYRRLKNEKKNGWLDIDEFNRIINGERLTAAPKTASFASAVTVKNQISRLTGTTAGADDTEGRLFNFIQYHGDTVSIYLKIADDYIETTRELFECLAVSGFGKRKTVGYGHFTVQAFTEFTGFTPPAEPDGFISLANFLPAAGDPVRGYWEAMTKYGRLGEAYARGGNPHKKPLVMFRAGSCFYDRPPREYYGRLAVGVSPQYPDVVQYGLALPVPFKFPES